MFHTYVVILITALYKYVLPLLISSAQAIYAEVVVQF